MTRIFTRIILSFSLLFLSVFCFSQTELWKKSNSFQLSNDSKVRRSSFPKYAEYFELDLDALKSKLISAPIRGQVNGQPNVVLSFPMASGKFENFSVMESPIMHPDLEAKFPMIKTYVAQGIDDPTATMRFSVTQFGLHVIILSGQHGTNYIDPYTTDLKTYIVYDKASLGVDAQLFECLTKDDVELPSIKNQTASVLNINDQKLRKFRLAQSCVAEYGNIFAGTSNQKANIQAQMAITINRVNSVYERDLSITLEFVANNDLIIYYGNINNDPWSGEYNTTTAQTIDAAIGISNYDIGHNFNTSGGGNSGCLGCVCVGSAGSQGGTHKGRGMTGRANPTGDAFDIDYVAHEMGHQFGGYHVMNTCSRSGNGTSEVEPASGSSVMGYAGICSSNVQTNSHDDFNYVNIRDISANIKTGNSTCAQITNLTNNPPTANAGSDYVIPKSTAYILEGDGNDIDGISSLTYNWSQNDPAQSPGNSSPLSSYAVGPLYRAIPPTISPNRWMPAITTVLSNTLASTWEVTPSVARVMNFSFIVRDNDASGGQTASDLMKVTVDGNSGPFLVTSQNAATNWFSGATEIITWNVANTSASPVNAANVNIYLSTDGGYTYPITLASNVANTGSVSINVPIISTSQGRIMVRGAGNIFYDINNSNITIQSSEFVINSNNNSINTCTPNDAAYTFTYNTFLGFNETTNFSVLGLPVGCSAIFNPATATASTVVTMSLTGITNAMVGVYTLSITGTATSVTKTKLVNLNLLSPTLNATTLMQPINGSTGIATIANLTWALATSSGVSYNLDIATDANFGNIVLGAGAIQTNSFTTSQGNLLPATTYYWRVKQINSCVNSPYSDVFMFTTNYCANVASVNVPKTISTTGTPTVVSTLTINANVSISDLNVVGLIGTHTYLSDLTCTLKSPAGTTVILFDDICGSNNNFNLNFDDGANAGAINCPATTGLYYQPQNPLSAFNGQNAIGIWTLTIVDGFNQDGGSLTGWGLSICSGNVVATSVSNTYDSNNTISIFPNPTSNLLNVFISSSINERVTYKITNNIGQLIETKTITTNQNYSIDISDNAAGIYFITIQGENGIKTQKIILNK